MKIEEKEYLERKLKEGKSIRKKLRPSNDYNVQGWLRVIAESLALIVDEEIVEPIEMLLNGDYVE